MGAKHDYLVAKLAAMPPVNFDGTAPPPTQWANEAREAPADPEQDAERSRAGHEWRVRDEMDRERARRDARTRLAVEARGTCAVPEILTLRDRLARPQTAAQWRIEGYQPADTRVLTAAQFKAGKTTLTGNVIRSLVDGAPFLGRAAVTPVNGSVILIDFEMSERLVDSWLRDQAIVRDDHVVVIPLRGRVASFDIRQPDVRAEWVARFRARAGAYLILDCVRPLLDALGLDEHRDAGQVLTALDALMAEAGITEALVVHHMGHTGERSRGDSRLRDWPDVEWRLMRQDDNPASTRFLTAYGRDVDMSEARLEFDPVTRHLTVAGGSRRDAASETALDAIRDVLLTTSAPKSGRAVKAALSDSEIPKRTIDEALRYGVRMGALSVTDGPRGAKLYRVFQCSGVFHECSGTVPCECSRAYIARNTETLEKLSESKNDDGTLDANEEVDDARRTY